MSAPALLLLCVMGAHASGQSAFDAGVAADRAGDYAAASEHFREALDDGARDPAVYHGLGNALYRQGQVGLAITAWRRGLRLSPLEGDLAANLDQARGGTQDRLDPPTPEVGPFFWLRSLSVAHTAAITSAALTAFLSLILLRRAHPRDGALARLATRLDRPLLLGLSAALALLFGASTALALREHESAVVTASQVEARSALGAEGVGLFALHEGAEVRVLESTADAALIALPDARKGWVSWRALASTDPAAPFPAAPSPAAPSPTGAGGSP